MSRSGGHRPPWYQGNTLMQSCTLSCVQSSYEKMMFFNYSKASIFLSHPQSVAVEGTIRIWDDGMYGRQNS